MFKALIYGQSIELTLPIFKLLKDAGFSIDYLSNQKRLAKHQFIDNFYYAQKIDEVAHAALGVVNNSNYDLVVATDDITLDAVMKSKLSIDEKLKILPVKGSSNLEHITSKVHLSKVLELGGVPTPKFKIVTSRDDLINFAEELNFPLIIKGDCSGGGTQTFKIEDKLNLLKVASFFCHYPAVLQEYITGKLIGVEAFYQEKKLIYLNYSESLETVRGSEFTPSSLRLFTQIGCLDEKVLTEIKKIGEVLGANGFVNISAILSAKDGNHYYFESDMRPTVWVNSSRFFGNPVSNLVKKYFLLGDTLEILPVSNKLFPNKFKLAYPPRVSFKGFLTNKFLVWSQINEDPFLKKILLRNLKHRILEIINLRYFRKKCVNFYKTLNFL